MYWYPARHSHGDVAIIKVAGRYHMFTNCVPIDIPGDQRAGNIVVNHAVSDDGFTWHERLTDFGDHPRGSRPDGAWDAAAIMHIDVLHHDGRWWLYYTATDRSPLTPPQRQTVGLAVSDDGYHFKRVKDAPVSIADPRWYEQGITEDANSRANLVGRTWYRDPFIFPTGVPGEWGMTVIARDLSQPPMTRGCLSLATSRDLIHWEPRPPLYSPGRFHTIETPSLFAHGGRHYLIFMSHHGWGLPYSTTDIYQTAGDFYAVSDDGPLGPYRRPDDEVLVGAMGRIRCGAQRLIDNHDGTFLHYGWLQLRPAPDDEQVEPVRGAVVTTPKLVQFTDDGEIRIMYNPAIEKFTQPANFEWRNAGVSSDRHGDFIFSAMLAFSAVGRSERVGVMFRVSDDGARGLWAVADRQHKRIELGCLGKLGFIDARNWQPRDRFELRIVAWKENIEIFVDGRLMIQQARHREKHGRFALAPDGSKATASDATLRVFR